MKHIKSPDELREFALVLAKRMNKIGLNEQAKILEHRATLPCTSGWEWLGELELGVKKIREISKLPKDVEIDLDIISKISTSDTPYS